MQGIASGIMIVIILVTRPGYFQNGVKLGGLFNLVNANHSPSARPFKKHSLFDKI